MTKKLYKLDCPGQLKYTEGNKLMDEWYFLSNKAEVLTADVGDNNVSFLSFL